MHRPVRVCLDNDFDLSMLTDRDEALMQSAQLVSDVEYLRSFGHTFYSVTMTLGKTASVSLEQYVADAGVAWWWEHRALAANN